MTVPRLVETIPPAPPVDPGTLTAAIENTPTVRMEVEGGSVEVSQQPLAAAQSPELSQPLPELPGEEVTAVNEPPAQQDQFAIALGEAVSRDQARQQWDQIAARVGPLLLGLDPLLAQAPEGEGQQLVAGPFETIAAATESCTRFAQIGISCLPAPFEGEPLP